MEDISPRERAGMVGFWWGLSLWLADSHLLALCPHGLSLYVYVVGEREISFSSSSYKASKAIGLGPHTYDLI